MTAFDHDSMAAQFDKTPHIKKWGKLLEHVHDAEVMGITAQLIEMSVRGVRDLDPQLRFVLAERLGEKFGEALIAAIATHVPKAAALHFVPWQSMSSPIGIIYSIQRVFESPIEALAGLDASSTVRDTYVPTVVLGGVETPISCDAVAAASGSRKIARALPSSSQAIESLKKQWGDAQATQSLFEQLVEELLTTNDRQIVADLMAARDTPIGKIDLSRSADAIHVDLMCAGQVIHRDSQRGPANTLVCAPEHAAKIETLNGFREVKRRRRSGGIVSGGRIHEVGVYADQARIFVDPCMPIDRMYYGYRSGSPLDTGAAYAPYQFAFQRHELPDKTTQLVLALRGGWKMLSPIFYGRLAVKQ